jgi:hypothetical protein
MSIAVWIRYRQSDVPLFAVFMSPLFVASPAYFREEGESLREMTVAVLAFGGTCLLIVYLLNRSELRQISGSAA